jgi:hypothetical protein
MARVSTLNENCHAGAGTPSVDRNAGLPDNIADLLGQAADAAGDRLAWNFFESGETIS